ncbi:LCP family protein [Streptomyces filamentosus]|uniref:Transcriptional regulator n=1 Tax=Streptomyces filamentosus TaxID=67294 RepID=A0A919ENB0_STRFL|nr:LCP family protein [Streptomyces filamentosus]GHF98762.1 transcriptional regulator [Streptomyces filamentosus]
MGQNSVRREGTQPSVPHARDRGWDDELHGAGEATGAGGEAEAASVPAPGGRAARRRGAGGGSDDDGTDTAAANTAGGRAAARRQAKKAGKRKVLRWSAIGVAVLVLGTAGAGYAYYEHLNSNIQSGGRAGGDSGVKKAPPNALGDTPLNILLIGSDSRADEKNIALGGSRKDKDRPPLADVQMLLHVSADRQNASLISIPRDTVVEIPDCKGEDGKEYPGTNNRPINETLTRGGPGCTLTTWEKLTGTYIDHWMMIDFAGVVAMADEVGGVPVCVKTGVWDRSTTQQRGGSGLQLPKGTHDVKGVQALQWLRTRHAFGSDQNRAKAQHMYLNGMMKRLQEQNAWSDTGRLTGLAETATTSIKVSDEISTVAKLFELGMQLKNVKLDRLTTVTIPTAPYAQNPDAWLQPVESSADKIWSMLRDDVALDKNGDKAPAKPRASASAKPKKTAAAPGTLPVTVVNGTDGEDEPAVEGRAKKIATALQGKGFAQAASAQEGKPSKGTVVGYPKAQGDQGRADAESVAKALGLPLSTVRADSSIQGITLVVGADWREGDTYKRPTHEAGDLPENADDKVDCMDVYSVYQWDGKSKS